MFDPYQHVRTLSKPEDKEEAETEHPKWEDKKVPEDKDKPLEDAAGNEGV